MRRIYQHEYPYFVTTKTLRLRQGLFEDIRCAAIAADVLRTVEAVYDCILFGFAIMPDHIHVLLQTQTTGKDISLILSAMKDNIYKRIRKDLYIVEPFWQRSFHANIKDTSDLFETAISYMKQNPRKGGLPKQYGQYPYQYYNDGLIDAYRGTLRRSG